MSFLLCLSCSSDTECIIFFSTSSRCDGRELKNLAKLSWRATFAAKEPAKYYIIYNILYSINQLMTKIYTTKSVSFTTIVSKQNLPSGRDNTTLKIKE
jgi:hypothetical protein